MIGRVLILGAGNAQIDAIRYLKAHGHEVYGCSYTDTDHGIKELTHFAKIDIKDIDKVAEYASKNKVEAVYSIGSDLAMPTVAAVSEMLSLPQFICAETATICQNKARLRRFLGDGFVGNLPFLKASSLEETASFYDFPAVMKPVDSQGQRGVALVKDAEEIEKNFAYSISFSSAREIILEKYIDGQEYSVNAYRVDGKTVFYLLSEREVFNEYPGGIIKAHRFPAGLAVETEEKIRDLVERVCNKLSIQNGPVYFQLKVDRKEERPYIIEVTPRLDGCHLWRLIRYACGVDLLEAAFQQLLFQKAPLFLSDTLACIGKEPLQLRFMCSEPGKRFDRSVYSVKDSLFHEWYYETGEVVRPLNGYMEKCGYVIERRGASL